MKRSKAILLFIFCALSSAAFAGTASSNLSVAATVSGNCMLSTSPVNFGAYDPVSANASADLNGSGTVTVTCTTGTTGTITLDQGANPDTGSTATVPLRRLSDGATNFLSYFLYQDSARSTVWANTAGTGVVNNGDGTATNVTVYGKVTAGQNVPGGSYSDTVVATVTF